jgi:hypothetical protein
LKGALREVVEDCEDRSRAAGVLERPALWLLMKTVWQPWCVAFYYVSEEDAARRILRNIYKDEMRQLSLDIVTVSLPAAWGVVVCVVGCVEEEFLVTLDGVFRLSMAMVDLWVS